MGCRCLQNVCPSEPFRRVTEGARIQDTLTGGQTKTRPCFHPVHQLPWGSRARTAVGKCISSLERVWEFYPHCNSHWNGIRIGAAIRCSIILTPRFLEVEKPSPVLASTLNIPSSFSGQLHWKQLESSSPRSVPPITSMCPLSNSVIWPLGKHSPGGPWRMPAFFGGV